MKYFYGNVGFYKQEQAFMNQLLHININDTIMICFLSIYLTVLAYGDPQGTSSSCAIYN